ncbi:MAG: response regulator transcription factor [Rhodocyclaceae bacterium]|jgi:DNA-binding NarL/FixJ family response regulator
MDQYRILVIEDHVLVRQALIGALGHMVPNMGFVEASSAQEALARLEAEPSAFDLVLADLMLPDMSGFTLLSMLTGRFPDLPILVVSGIEDDVSIRRAYRAGVAGFLPKTVSTEVLANAIQTVLAGGVLASAAKRPVQVRSPRRHADAVASHYGLTAAQMRVLELMIEGRTNREIAHALGITEGTVKLHCSAILKALEVSNRAQVLVMMARQGFTG